MGVAERGYIKQSRFIDQWGDGERVAVEAEVKVEVLVEGLDEDLKGKGL